MTAAWRILRNWFVLSLLTAFLLIVLFAVLAPLLIPFFAGWTVRLSFVLSIMLIWLGLTAWRILSAHRASDRIERKLGIAETEQEGDLLARRLREATAALKREGGASGDYLYSRPWYVMIGPPGAGKTTALLNSGLRIPPGGFAERGSAGTRNIDFLFADEAVLLDTAGRYTSQDSDAVRDRQAWLQFLDLLRVNRPLQPVNGVIVAIGLDELAGAGLDAIERHARIIKARLSELQEALKVEVPVYTVFTKCDLLAGFLEFYGDLDVDARRAVLGTTLPWKGPVTAPASDIATRFDELIAAIDARTAKRLQEDMDVRRRSLIVGFPNQIAALRGRLLYFLDRAFAQENRRAPIALRGFYLTSGIQLGTPVDRVLARVATLFDAPVSGRAGERGRAYFINRLLGEVIIGEAGLVQRTPAIIAKERTWLAGGGTAIAASCLALIALWTVSYFENRAWLSDLTSRTNAVRAELASDGVDLSNVRDTDPDGEQVLPTLDELRALPGGYAERHGDGHSIWLSFGLYQESLGRLAEITYLDTAQRVLLPRMLLRLERSMRIQQGDRFGLYDTLKAYLMAGGQAPRLDSQFLHGWVSDDLSGNVYPGPDSAPLRARLLAHLDAVLGDPQFGQLWRDPAAVLDGDLVQRARATVESMSLSDRAYAILRQNAARISGADWRADTVLNPGAAKAFANGQTILSRTVPFLFTKDGYSRAYQLALTTVQLDLRNDMWVLGPDQAKLSTVASFQAIRQGVAIDYARDYIDAWNGVLTELTPANYFSNPDALAAAVSQPSPIKLIMQEVARNTRFAGQGGAIARTLAQRWAPNASSTVESFHPDLSQPNDAASTIDTAFRDLHTYVNATSAPSLDDFLGKLRDAANALAVDRATASTDPGSPDHEQFVSATGQLAAAAQMAPTQIRAFAQAASTQGDSARASQTQSAIAKQYNEVLLQSCQSTTNALYPFVQASQKDASAADLMPVFGSNSQFDNFIAMLMRGYLQTGPIWRWNTGNLVAVGFDPDTPAQLQRIQALHDLLVNGVEARIEAISFGGTITAAEFFAGGSTIRFEQGQTATHSFLWTAAVQPEARVTLYAGTQVQKPVFEFGGTWAMFRLFDAARMEASGQNQFTAAFGDGSSFVVFRITLVGAHNNPFSRAGLWSLRCPPRL